MTSWLARPILRLLVLLMVVQVVLVFTVVSGSKTYYVYWNTSNPIFQISNTDHIIDVNRGNSGFEYDQVTLICPLYDQNTSGDDAEKYIIYNVSKEEYDTCRITDPNPRIIAVCDKPHQLMFFTITFRSFTPQPGGLEFRPGQDYYFISTSAQGDILRRIGGRCTTDNMKVVFKVCCKDSDAPVGSQQSGPGITPPTVGPDWVWASPAEWPSHTDSLPGQQDTTSPGGPGQEQQDGGDGAGSRDSAPDSRADHTSGAVASRTLQPNSWLCTAVLLLAVPRLTVAR